jgi:quercetin dioxygenase-like cupin family protein
MLVRTLRQEGDSMPWSNARILLLVALVGVYPMVGHATEPSQNASVQAENLLRESIAGADGKEVIVSRVSFPPHTELPWHWHPGEEFFYVIEGSVTLKQRGEPDLTAAQGGAQKIAPQVVHTGRTGERGAELVIFRVHATGEPERYLVD